MIEAAKSVDPVMNSGPGQRTLALIPAKGGSVRVSRKNLRELGGKSLLGWTVDCALSCEQLDRVVVSTEDDEIARVASALGAEVPFMRPDRLAGDPYNVVDVCLHALDALEAKGDQFDILVILLPTSPFRRARHISEALHVFNHCDADFLMSVSMLDHSLLAAHVLKDHFLTPLHPEWIGRLGARAKEAELPALAKANGAITIASVPRFRQERAYYVYPLAAYPMSWPAGLDVDTETDLLIADEALKSGRVHAE